MSSSLEQAVRAAVMRHSDSVLAGELGTSGAIDKLVLVDGNVQLTLRLGFPAAHYKHELAATLNAEIHRLPGVKNVQTEILWSVTAPQLRRLSQIQQIK